ncbi:MAG TPA: galactitol-1-phosphate 5-dehydrogenase [Candidatus Acidoferrum sp.]|jgi:L-iditol 2-dehydrogenase|nr:galactitol-1-phosphate 5-dehydrogenase [Candidatus Acidoferrum sp.]
MKALVLKEYKRFAYEEVPAPEPGPDEVLIAVKACGICGSDVHGMDGSTGRRRPPIIMGHEAAGVIAGTGKEATTWHSGETVTFDSTIYCGHCDYCRRGQVNLCDNRRVLGVSCEDYRQHGAFAEFVVVPQRILYRVPEGLPSEHAALVEPFAIALHAIRRSPPTLNDAVVVVGAGMIGLALVQGLSQTGCGRLIVVDVAADRLALAAKLGATHTVNSADENAAEAILRLTQGRGADLAFEAVGLTPTVDLALLCLRKSGAVTLVGNVAPKIEFPLQAAVTRELRVFGSCASRGEYPACLQMLSRGALKAAPLISAVAPLTEGAEWFERLRRKEAGLLKVILRP